MTKPFPTSEFRAPLRIGLHSIGGRDWIAGQVYIANLAAALRLLPVNERPELTIWTGPRRSNDALRALSSYGKIQTFGYFDGRPLLRSFAGAALSLAKGGSSRCLTTAASRSGVSALFRFRMCLAQAQRCLGSPGFLTFSVCIIRISGQIVPIRIISACLPSKRPC